MAALAATAIGFSACSEDSVDEGMSVIKDSQTPQNALDRWLYQNYVLPYNIELRYRWEDNETSMVALFAPKVSAISGTPLKLVIKGVA